MPIITADFYEYVDSNNDSADQEFESALEDLVLFLDNQTVEADTLELIAA